MISFNNMFRNKARYLYDILSNLKQCTFDELKERTHFSDVDLCFALCSLIKVNKIYQKKIDDVIVYGVA